MSPGRAPGRTAAGRSRRLADVSVRALGMGSGWMSTKPVLDRIVAAIDAHLVENVEQSALMSPFARMAEGIPGAERAALAADARRAIAEDYRPALRRFKAFIQRDYRPKAPGIAGFKGTTDDFIEHLRTDKKFYFDSPEAVLTAYRAIAPRVDPQLPNLFHNVPRMPYAVRGMTSAPLDDLL